MIPESTVKDVLSHYVHACNVATPKEEAMRQALHWALKNICSCGEPLTLGVVHHKNAPCEVAK